MFAPDTRILIVDDMKTMRMVVKKHLTTLGFTNIEEADDGETGWTAFENSLVEMNPYRVILSDWTMPKMTGLDFLKKVRAHPKAGHTLFMLITAEAEAAQIKQAIACGVNNYITKPFSAETLKEKMTALHQLYKKRSA